MAETLAPVLSGGAASFERPTQQGGSYFEAAANLLNFFGQASEPATPRQPTQDELFGQAWNDAIAQAGISLDPSNPNYRTNLRGFAARFNQAYPEYASQVNAQLGLAGLDNTLTVPQQAASATESAILEFTSTPVGQIAYASAVQAATRDDGSVDEGLMTERLVSAYQQELGMQVGFEELRRQAETVQMNDQMASTLSTQAWDIYKPQAENIVDDAFIELRNIVTAMRADPGGQVQIPEELAMQFGLSTTTINANNFVPFLTQYRSALQRTLRDGLYARADVDSSMLRPATNEWYDEVLAPLDALIASGANGFDNATQVLDNTIATQDLATLREIRATEPQLARAIDLARVMPPEMRLPIFSAVQGLGINEAAVNYVLNTLSAEVATTDRQGRLDDMSRDERADAVTVAEAVLAQGTDDSLVAGNAVTDFLYGVGDQYMGLDIWTGRLLNNATAISERISQDPEFAQNFTRSIQADLNMTIQQLRNEMNAYPGVVLNINEDGQAYVTVDEAAINRILDGRGLGAVDRAQAFDDMMNVASTAAQNPLLSTYNTKLGTLGQFGNVSNEILDAFVMENQNLIPVDGAGGEPSGGGGMTQSESSPSSAFQLPPQVASDQEFIDQVFLVSERLGVNPNDMLAIMHFETGGTFDPAQRNAAGSGATGLIQFMPSTAEGLGTTTEALANMSRVEQMSWVERYFQPYAGRMNDIGDMYMAVLWPAAVGQPDDYVLFSQEDGTTYSQNAGLDTNGDGVITKAEAVAKVLNRAGGNYSRSANPTSPSILAPEASVRPLQRQEREELRPSTRPMARPTSEAPTQSVRPQARPTQTRQGASTQAVTNQRNRAIDILTRGGFTKEELSALGII
jgi:hypothetical protein